MVALLDVVVSELPLSFARERISSNHERLERDIASEASVLISLFEVPREELCVGF